MTRQSVLTLYRHRPPEIGVPSENPRLDERGLVVTGFVDRAGDPLGVMAADGSFHRGEVLIADALRALTHTVAGGPAPTQPPGVAVPAHWRAAAVDAVRRELTRLPEWAAGPTQLTLVPDAAAVLTALEAGPGLPTRGVVALCDFGGTGTSITLADAADGYRPIGATLRHTEFSGELIDRAVLAHVIADLSVADSADVAGTAALGSLHRLRAECRAAKERLSRGAVTTLFADFPGFRGDVRLTRAELDDEIRRPLMAFIEVLRELLFRNRIHAADLAAVASVGGGANIPAVTTALSERLRVPVITTPHPELTAARGAAIRAVRRPEEEGLTVVASAPASGTGTLRALAWSEVDDVPDIPVIATELDAPRGVRAARARVRFTPEEPSAARTTSRQQWCRPLLVTGGTFAAMVLVGTGAVLAIRNDAAATTGMTTTTTVRPDPITAAAAPPVEPPAEQAPSTPSFIKAPGLETRVVTTPPPVAMAAPPPVGAAPLPVAPPPGPTQLPTPTTTPTTMPTTTTSSPPSSSPLPSEPPSSSVPSTPPSSSAPATPPSHEDPPPAKETPSAGEAAASKPQTDTNGA